MTIDVGRPGAVVTIDGHWGNWQTRPALNRKTSWFDSRVTSLRRTLVRLQFRERYH
jgi:hypothetical protein